MSTYQEIVAEIEKLEPLVDERIKSFDEHWFDGETDNSSKPFEEYITKRNLFVGDIGKRLNDLYTLERMQRPVELSELSDYGDVMSLDDFIENVNNGWFIDYDGFGHYVQDGKETNIEIYPSDVKKRQIRKGFDTIVWFNR